MKAAPSSRMNPARQTRSTAWARRRATRARVEGRAGGELAMVERRASERRHAVRARGRGASARLEITSRDGGVEFARGDGVDDRLQVAAPSGDEDAEAPRGIPARHRADSDDIAQPRHRPADDLADHETSRSPAAAQSRSHGPATSSAATATIMPIPMLKVRQHVVAGHLPAVVAGTRTSGGDVHEAVSMHRRPAGRQDARQVLRDAAARDVRESLDERYPASHRRGGQSTGR